MKRILLSVLIIGLALTILFPLSVSAKSIPTINVTNNNNKLTVSGTTENGVLAVAIMVYSGNDIYHMETCSSNDNKFSCELSKTFATGDYTVKVADYDGGNYVTKNVSIKDVTDDKDKDKDENNVNNITNNNIVNDTNTTTNEVTQNTTNPVTGDNIVFIIALFIVALVGTAVTYKIRKNNSKEITTKK